MQGTTWIKSSWSYANGNCVEVRALPGGKVEVRNSRIPGVQLPPFTPEEWAAFTAGVRAGEFDLDASAMAGR
jgi:predicted secreted Zn-dependent protease